MVDVLLVRAAAIANVDKIFYPTYMSRIYLPTLSELIDRLSIVQMKMTFAPEHSLQYQKEALLILHDIDEILSSLDKNTNAKLIYSVLGLMLANRFIWENESKVRAGQGENDYLLKVTHSINAVRTAMKNKISEEMKERAEYKADCLAAELPDECGNWSYLLSTLKKEPEDAISEGDGGLKDSGRISPDRSQE